MQTDECNPTNPHAGVKISAINYTQDHIETQCVQQVENCLCYKDTATVTWINVEGLQEVSTIQQIGQYYGLHPLIIEDIFDTQQRSKIEVFENYLLMVLKMHTYDTSAQVVEIEQVCLILGSNFVLTFQEGREGDVFEPVRTRLLQNKGRLRKEGADFLAYALVGAVIEGYLQVIELLGEQLEEVEEDLLETTQTKILAQIHFLKRELIYFRRSVWPLRTMIGELERHETTLIQTSTAIYFRDLNDHILQIIDSIEIYRDMLTGMLEMYLSSASNRMNEVIKFLTIIGTIFIPLTFLAGVYGMNFRYMPELTWHWGYYGIWAIMLAIALGLIAYFRRKGWL